MGDSEPAYEVGTFSSCADDLHIEEILSVVYLRDCSTAWSASIYSVGQDPRFTTHFCRVSLQKVVISMYFYFSTKTKFSFLIFKNYLVLMII